MCDIWLICRNINIESVIAQFFQSKTNVVDKSKFFNCPWSREITLLPQNQSINNAVSIKNYSFNFFQPP